MKYSTALKKVFWISSIFITVALAWGLRMHAVALLPIDYDEDDYMRAAQEYAGAFRSLAWQEFTEKNYRNEHPPLAKILYGLVISGDPQAPLVPDRPTSANPSAVLPQPHLSHARELSAVFGTLTVLALAITNPLAGLILAAHTFTIKYTSQLMLEAVPAFTSFMAVLFYILHKKKAQRQERMSGFLAISGLFLGMTAASKYIYSLVGVAILIDWFLAENHIAKPFSAHRTLTMAIWAFIAFSAFYLFDPYLWPNPFLRLKDSVFYHVGYSTSAAEVQSASFPFWQPFIWMGMSVPWNREAFPIALDTLIFLFALVGGWELRKENRIYLIWLVVGVFFLLMWPTKWPQYILTITVPLSVASAMGLKTVVLSFRRNIGKKEGKTYRKGELRRGLPWILPGLVVFIVLTLFPLFFQAAMALTDFNIRNIREGINGGVWRALWQGLSFQGNAAVIQTKVNFVGITNFPLVMNNIVSQALVTNILWTVVSVGLQTALGLSAALLLWNKRVLFRKAWQLLFILPWAIPEMIGALMWANIIWPDTGWLSLAAKKFGESSIFAHLVPRTYDTNALAVVLLIAATWYGFPFMMLVAAAGLKMLPADVYDAAAIDGANGWQAFKAVTLPLLLPLLFPAIIIRGIFAFNQFYLFQVFRMDVTLAQISYNIFNPVGGYGQFGGQFAISATLNILTMLILTGFLILFNRSTKAGEGVTYA